jgi:hypothetical protein
LFGGMVWIVCIAVEKNESLWKKEIWRQKHAGTAHGGGA